MSKQPDPQNYPKFHRQHNCLPLLFIRTSQAHTFIMPSCLSIALSLSYLVLSALATPISPHGQPHTNPQQRNTELSILTNPARSPNKPRNTPTKALSIIMDIPKSATTTQGNVTVDCKYFATNYGIPVGGRDDPVYTATQKDQDINKISVPPRAGPMILFGETCWYRSKLYIPGTLVCAPSSSPDAVEKTYECHGDPSFKGLPLRELGAPSQTDVKRQPVYSCEW
ncbi:hypothetical protein CC86DRAFT_12110 [Ophiobolus disseminans]|uniref:Uncharacterized protein n=1 Tax=Ophiobolus disseminans TaxID=1469910 RepID=A0A6A7ALK9_9PLEO|nr:hypothetical protein CC86DRAFT_12110 [Ophiobolus disseminans]